MSFLFLMPMISCQTKGTTLLGEEDTAVEEVIDEVIDEDGDGYPADEDCDDTEGAIYPGALEICDEIDNDCDGEIDEDAGGTYYPDGDDDGFGDPDLSELACTRPEGTVSDGGDCDDGNADIHPDAEEVCEGSDNDCDGLVDLDDDSLDTSTAESWYSDSDGDGFGDASNPMEDCTQPEGTTTDGSDCDDGNADIHPDAEEVCDGVDNNCDGITDGGIQYNAVTSTYTYQGTESLSELQDELSASTQLCTTDLESAESFSGPLSCGSDTSNIGSELVVVFFVTEETAGTWAFRLGPDYGLGGAIFIDDTEVDQAVDDLWWNYDWSNSGEILEGSSSLSAGIHTFNAIGFESCCSGDSSLQYSVSDADWADVTVEVLGLDCEP